MTTATSTVPGRRGRPIGENPQQGFKVRREYIPRQFVRRTINVDLELDRRIRERAQAAGATYSRTVEKAIESYVEALPAEEAAS